MNYCHNRLFFRKLLPIAFLMTATLDANASCGSGFCTLNTHWNTQGATNNEGFSLDLRYSQATADVLRSGDRKVSADAPSGSDSEIENKRTILRLLTLDLDYSLSARWNIGINIPLVARDHTHTFDSSGSGPFEQQGKFTEVGDIRLMGKYKFDGGTLNSGDGIRFGIKLPSGVTDKTMTPPDPADPTTPYKLERSAQPGTGSTDLILGFYHFGRISKTNWGWFFSAQVQNAIQTSDHYRPGTQENIDLGANYAWSHNLNGYLQINFQHQRRDSDLNANQASGGYSLNLSPGLAYTIGEKTRVYGFIQVPILQHVNSDPSDTASAQLTAPWSLSVGINHWF
ncbi:conserved exported hypothetical protein [Gammaproteobacteria bacterium]